MMLPFPHCSNPLEKPFGKQQPELNPLPPPSSPYFPIFASDILPLPPSAVTGAVPLPSPPALPPVGNSLATASPLMRKKRGGSFTRKRSWRKDRNSKILTAKGPRDRRIRLSNEVARKFFDLQDMLGFDQGSKTVQWLFNMSKHAIQELTAISVPQLGGLGIQSPPSFALGLEKSTLESDSQGKSTTKLVAPTSVKNSRNERQVIKPSGNAGSNLMRARESRAKARARARERTTEKRRMWLLSSTIASHATRNEGSHLLNLRSSLLGSIAEMEERQRSSSHTHCIRFSDQRNYDFPAQDGSCLIPIFGYSDKIADHSDMDNILQEQSGMERMP
ncbi:hypothetical protein OPV22_023767 [Ensete ventricosum]|uniref:TCP domain-containing protein n=2 Tax=Zingiberales TaxID=4618 RepID=A0A445MIT9_ENSVE|nr:hypothetical protein OPV22_023767 [Ensete ventricosum]RZR74187.1 hypothetical protein BHM03_00033272 [Ensete ventricosum]